MIGKRFRSLPFIFANDNYTLSVVTRNIGLEGGAMAHTVEFERCVDFLARMIEKYGSELLQELNGLPKEDKAEDNCQQEQQQNTLGND